MAQIYICIDWLSRQRPFTCPQPVWLHIFMTRSGQHGAALPLPINHPCFTNHHWLHLSLSYLLLSSEKRREVSLCLLWFTWHDLCICRREFSQMNPVYYLTPPPPTPPNPSSSEERRKGYTSVKWQRLWKIRVQPTWLSSDTSSSPGPQTLFISSTSDGS